MKDVELNILLMLAALVALSIYTLYELFFAYKDTSLKWFLVKKSSAVICSATVFYNFDVVMQETTNERNELAETHWRWQEDKSRMENIAIYDDWPRVDAKFIVDGPTLPIIDQNGRFATRFRREGEEFNTLIRHSAVDLKMGDEVTTTRDGKLTISARTVSLAGKR